MYLFASCKTMFVVARENPLTTRGPLVRPIVRQLYSTFPRDKLSTMKKKIMPDDAHRKPWGGQGLLMLTITF